MGLLSGLSNWFTTGTLSPSVGSAPAPIDGTDLRLMTMFGLNEGKVNVTEDTVTGISTVHACVEKVSKSIASFPWDVLYKTDYRTNQKALDHPCYYLLSEQPHPLYDTITFRRTMLVHYLLRGNFYAEIETDSRNVPIGLLIWQSWEVDPYRYNNRLYYKLKDGRVLQDYQMIHLKDFSTDGLIGRSKISLDKEAFELSLQTQRFGTSFLRNGTRLSGVLTTDQRVTTDSRRDMRLDWEEQYGPNGQGKTAFLSDGWKYQQLGIPPGDAQFLETRQYSRSEICAIFGVPLHMVAGVDGSTISGTENMNIWYATHTLMPIVASIEKEFGRKLFRDSERGKVTNKINMNALMRADSTARANYFHTMRSDGVMSANEIRALEDMNPYEGGDMYTVQGAQVPVDQLADFYKAKINAGNVHDMPAPPANG